ncbi:MAG TPA: ribonuclease J [Myxococcales bacterium]|nr:ribonuclease J [Myxococcales bacterium]
METSPAPVRLVPLGGLGEVGMNCLSVETAQARLVIDCGVLFPAGEAALGVEIITPDFAHLRAEGPPVAAVLLTHAHEDHVGALPYLLREHPEAPVCGTRYTLGVVKEKLSEHGISPRFVELSPRVSMSFGGMEVEPLQVTHSIPDAVGYALRTPAGVVVHTGDFKVDWSPPDGRLLDVRRFAELGDEGVSCLLSDSTNAERPGASVSESEVGESMARIFGAPQARGRIVVAMFGSNIHRVQSVVRAAVQHGRKVCLLGRSLQQNVRLALDMGYLRCPPDLFVDPEAAGHFGPLELAVVCTGAQGEPHSALSRIALGEHPAVKLTKGDLVILSSRSIPGNERAVANLVDHLVRRGCRVLSTLGESAELIHTTGHACQSEQRMIVDLVRPRSFLPVHGEFRMLAAHARTAEAAGVDPRGCLVAEDGDVVELRPEGPAAVVPGAAAAGRIYLDSRGALADVGEVVLRDRRLLADSGMLVCLCVLDRKSGALLREPELSGRGVAGLDESRVAEARAAALSALEELLPAERTDRASVEEALRRAVRSVFKKGFEKRPMVLPVVLEM